jgi:hypothetical protein
MPTPAIIRPLLSANFQTALPIAKQPKTQSFKMKLFLNFAKVFWAAPNTLVGLVIGLTGLLFGGHVRRVGRAIEFYEGGIKWFLHQLPNGHFILAMTLGHVVLGQTDASLEISREHEAVHVEQYERWGPFMLPAYLLSSVYVWLRGGRFYRDNHFEREARARDHHRENN